MESLECHWVMEYMDKSLNKQATIPLEIVELIIAVIKVVTMEEVYLGLNIPSNIPLEILDKVLVVMVELDIGFIPSTLPPPHDPGDYERIGGFKYQYTSHPYFINKG